MWLAARSGSPPGGFPGRRSLPLQTGLEDSEPGLEELESGSEDLEPGSQDFVRIGRRLPGKKGRPPEGHRYNPPPWEGTKREPWRQNA